MTTMAKKITINDVADVAGVSVTTVSLVLSGKGRISTATGLRVNEAIEKLGFVRNRQAALWSEWGDWTDKCGTCATRFMPN